MKKINIFSILFLLLFAVGCEDEVFRPVVDLTGGNFTSAEFTNSATGTGTLSFETAADVFETLEWSKSDYGINVPIKYTVEAAASADFATPYVMGSTASTSLPVTVEEMNDAALSMGLVPFEDGDVFFRIISEVQGSSKIDNLVSTSITRTIAPYVTDFPPIYMIGDAVKGWDTALAVDVYGVGPNQYEVIAEFNNGGAFRFFSAADWNAVDQYNWTYFEGGTVDANFENAMDGDTNLRFVGTTGFYKIGVNLNTKTITMEMMEQPTLYIVGAGTPAAGWSWDTPVEFTWIKDGVWEATTDFINDAFRFFSINGDWNSGKNYPFYDGLEYDIDDKLEDALDGDNNFKFNGEPGEYKIIINEIDKTIVMANVGTAGPPIYVVGDGTQAGWDWGTRVDAFQFDAGVFTAALTLNTNGAFRFFTVDGDWNSGRNHPYYVGEGYTIDPTLIDALDGDNNFKFTGVPGDYLVIIDENAKTITLTGGAGESLWAVGAGLPSAGWDWATPVELYQIGTGIYAAKTEFAADAFRFFTVYNDWNSGRNYPYYDGEGYAIDANFEDAMDGDNNFRFIGTPGVFTITLDTVGKTITLQ